MTRVTAPRELAKQLTRTLSSTAAAPRPSRLLYNASKTAAARVRSVLDNASADAPASERSMTTGGAHRPAPNPHRTIPLMQTFHSSQRTAYARGGTSYIDSAVLPSFEQLFPPTSDPFSRVRVPLLPDNYTPDRAAIEGHAPEVEDAPLSRPEIVVMAADPAIMSAVSALTEIEGMSPNGVELTFAHDASRSAYDEDGDAFAGGMLKDLWKGLVDDVFGAEKVKPSV